MPPPDCAASWTSYEPSTQSMLGGLVLEGILIGVYTVLLSYTIGMALSYWKKGQHKFVTMMLLLLYMTVIMNFIITWLLLRNLLMDSDLENYRTNLLHSLAHATEPIAPILADILIAWRCYIIWNRNRWVLGIFTVLIIGEIVVSSFASPSSIMPESCFGDGRPPNSTDVVAGLFYFFSLLITLAATSMITYRIMTLSKDTGDRSKYRHTSEILVESGALYSFFLFLCGLLWIFNAGSRHALQANNYLGGMLSPISGIAPTLITLRVILGHARDEAEWTRPLTRLSFRDPSRSQRNTTTISTSNGRERPFVSSRLEAVGSRQL